VQEVDIPPIHNALAEAMLQVSTLAADTEARSKARAQEVTAWAEERAARLNLQITVRRARCRPEAFGEHMVPLARVHDFTMVVLDSQDRQRLSETEALIFGSGGPVIAMPGAGSAVPIAEERMTPASIFVAWDGSRAAARALRDALPLIGHADTVSIVTVDDDKRIDKDSIAGVRELLGHHGIQTRHIARRRGATSIGESLQAAAIEGGGDLLIMGAYGHPRVQEFVLGGATRTILREARLPILFSH
jgi:nucleotide-binding universal stress UspA family protein